MITPLKRNKMEFNVSFSKRKNAERGRLSSVSAGVYQESRPCADRRDKQNHRQ